MLARTGARMRLPFALFSLLGAVLFLAAAPSPKPSPKPERTPHLSGNVVPISYDILIGPPKISSRGGTAVGSERIDVVVHRPTRAIVLNAFSRIVILHATIDGKAATTTKYPIAQQMAFATGAVIAPGKHILTLHFIGRILRDANGLWPDGFTRKNTPNFVTLFEPSTARTLFPCFDEPRFHARFRLRVIAPSDWRVVSNAPLQSHAPVRGNPTNSMFTFAWTPPIPTYLFTLDMGRFITVRGHAAGVPVAVYVAPGAEKIAATVLHTAEQSLTFYSHLFGVRYPMPKLDIVVAAGVLNDVEEGLGAITIYTESDVSGKQSNGGLADKQTAFDYVAQPISQQWFGGLVGIRSWNDAWLTQGLSSWATQKAEQRFHPEFAAIPQDDDWSWNAMSLWGSLDALHDRSVDDRDPSAFKRMMAGATDTGVAVLTQWEAYIGAARMKAAVHRFLIAHAWHTATDADFWHAFRTPQARRYGASWMNQPGAPALELHVSCVAGTRRITFAQTPLVNGYFRSSPGARWSLPISVTYAGVAHWLLLDTRSTTASMGTCDEPFTIDAGLRPPYPTLLPLSVLDAVAHAPSAAPIDRTRILRDTAALYASGLATMPQLLAAVRIDPGYAVGQAFLRDVTWDLQGAATALVGTPYERVFTAEMNAALLPFVRSERTAKGPLAIQTLSELYDPLAYAPKKSIALPLLRIWRHEHAPKQPIIFNTQADWWTVTYAASAGTPADFQWALAHVPDNNGINDPAPFLFGARDPHEILAIIHALRLKHVDYPSVLWRFGRKHPHLISAYLVRKTNEVLQAIPAAKRGKSFADGIARGPWVARTPAQWQRYLDAVLPKSDAPAIDHAMKIIRDHWKLRRRLEGEFSAPKSACRRC